MEGGSLGEEQNNEFIRMLFSWSPLVDIFNQDLYKNKVENIPLTFVCEEHYFGSFVYPLLEETRAELASSMEIMYRAPFAEILSFNESKCGENMVYDVSVGPWKNPFSERGKDAYQTSPGDLLVLVDGKPESISDLRCVGRTWALSSIKINEDDNTSLSIKVKASKPIEFQDGMFAVFVMNITTERIIWNSLHIHRNLNIIKEVLYSQLKEAESIISLQLGDEHQLPAVVNSNVCIESCFGRSLLSSLGHLLNVQYRMHPSISVFPNRMFYQNQIQVAPNVLFISHEKTYLSGKREKSLLSEFKQNCRTHAGVLDLAQNVIDILYSYFVHSIDNLEPETSLISGEAPESGNDENAIVTIFGGSDSGEVVGFGAEQVILVRGERAKTEIYEYVGRQALVLTILECKGLEFHFFYEINFVMAALCFERAGDTIWEKLAKASGLRASADQMRGKNHEAFKSYVREAAGIFESIGKLESAASCYCDLTEYERADTCCSEILWNQTDVTKMRTERERQRHLHDTNDHAAVTDFDSLGEAVTGEICSRLDLFEVTRMRLVNKSLRNLTMSAAFARVHKRRGTPSNWVITQYHTEENPDLGIIKAFRLIDERLVTFDLQRYGIHVGEHESLELKCTFGSIFLFHVVPHGSLRVLNLSNGRVTTILTPNPPFNQASFGQIHEFKMIQDQEFNYKIIYAQVINQRVEYFEYSSTNERWRNVIAQPVPNMLHVSTHDPRSMIFESEQVRFVCFRGEQPLVLSQDAHHLTQQAFAQEGAFERNEEGARVVDELVNLWSRGSHGWFAIVESNDQDAFNLRIQGIVLFRLRGDWSRVELISRMQAEFLPPHGYRLTQPLLEEVDGMVHLSFSAERLGGWGSLVFSFNPNSGGWTLREEHDATFTAVGASPTFITTLNMMPGVDA